MLQLNTRNTRPRPLTFAQETNWNKPVTSAERTEQSGKPTAQHQLLRTVKCQTAAKFHILTLNMFLEEMLGLPLETGSDFSQGKQLDVDHWSLLDLICTFIYKMRCVHDPVNDFEDMNSSQSFL